MELIGRCTKCKTINKEPFNKCIRCGGIIHVEHNGAYKPDIKHHLGEGNTPIVPLLFEKSHGIEHALLKLENLNPTGSFKDRGSIVTVDRCVNLGIEGIVVASSGNASGSMAAYCSRAKLDMITVVPASTPKAKLYQAQYFGAEIIVVDGNFSNSYNHAIKIAQDRNYYNATTTFLNPYSLIGYETIAAEILNEQCVPDNIFVPLGAGPLLVSLYNYYTNLNDSDLNDSDNYISKKPRFFGVQAENCAPIHSMFLMPSLGFNPNKECKSTIASGINDPLTGYEDDGRYTLEKILESDGAVIALSEEEIYESTYILARQGVFVEPAGAVGVLAIVKSGVQKEKNMVIVTGNCYKNPISLQA